MNLSRPSSNVPHCGPTDRPQPGSASAEHGEDRNVFLAILDISGYTRFMVAQKSSLVHAQVIISDLMRALLAEVQIPLEIAKLEGDAVFLFCDVDKAPATWQSFSQNLNHRFLRFFDRFHETLGKIQASNMCACSACSNLNQLKLKLVCHFGRAVIHQIAHFQELAGVDVIIVHRLLKNSVPSREYLLLTEPAWLLLDEGNRKDYRSSRESYETIGPVPTFFRVLEQTPLEHSQTDAHQPSGSWLRKMAGTIGLMLKSALVQLHLKKLLPFHNLNSNTTDIS